MSVVIVGVPAAGIQLSSVILLGLYKLRDKLTETWMAGDTSVCRLCSSKSNPVDLFKDFVAPELRLFVLLATGISVSVYIFITLKRVVLISRQVRT